MVLHLRSGDRRGVSPVTKPVLVISRGCCLEDLACVEELGEKKLLVVFSKSESRSKSS